MKQQRCADANGKAANSRYNRLLAVVKRMHEILRWTTLRRIGIVAHKSVYIVAASEAIIHAADQCHANIVGVVCPAQAFGKGRIHAWQQCVLFFRTIYFKDKDACVEAVFYVGVARVEHAVDSII